MKVYSISLLLMGFLIWSGCSKPPIYNDTPTITSVKFSESEVQQQTGLITFLIGFTDGDGDLGTTESGDFDLLIIDTRRNDTSFYQIPIIPSKGVASGISGEIEVDVSQICCIDPDLPIACSPIANTYQEVTYKVKIRDQAGRWSNEAESPALSVKCFE
ncbi:MAG: hypothetical protein GY810_20925 [Aureispira sp.]|nr:hypothetical protein [Aureispira sp.]